jgi:hypothetical protein
MVPGKYNIVCPQGSTFSQELTYSINDVAVDLTGYEAAMQVREKHSSTTVIATMNTDNGGIQLLGGGMIRINLSNTATAAIKPKEYVYDLEITTDLGVVNRILEGKFIVTPEVTR